MKKLLALLLVFTLLCGCGAQSTSAPAEEAPVQQDSAAPVTSEAVEELGPVTQIQLKETSVNIDGDGARAQDSTVRIEKAGNYRLSGTLNNGQIIVEVDKDSDVTLIFAGVNISCADSAPIYIKKINNCDIILEEGTENYLTDGAIYELEPESDEPDAAIFSKGDLKFKGTGTLTVSANYDMAIHGKDDVKFKEGNYILTAVEEAIKGKDSVEIEGGTFDIASSGDGIKANNDVELGFITISGGDITLTSQEDGITAEGDVNISGGSITLTSQEDGIQSGTAMNISGGTLNLTTVQDAIQSETAMNISGGDITIDAQQDAIASTGDMNVTGGNINLISGGGEAAAPEHFEGFGPGGGGRPRAPWEAATEEEEDSISAKGLKSDANLTISGGTIKTDCMDDAVHAALTVTIEEGADLELSSGDDGIHSDETLIINGGKVNIVTSYEGLEALYIQVHGGETTLLASDDGINAAGGTGGGFPMPFPGWGGEPETIETATYYVQITGGKLVMDASGDGLDSNGALFIEGGEVYLSGPDMSMNGALDYTTAGVVNGGKILISGCNGMAMNFDWNSTQTAVMYRLETNHTVDNGPISVLDGGEEVMTFAPQKTYGNVIISFPGMEVGKEYVLKIGDEELPFTPTDTISTLGASRGGGFGGGPGGPRPR